MESIQVQIPESVEFLEGYELVVGLETHIQLATESKLFCSCPVESQLLKVNQATCPICLGHPGALPTLNQKALELAVIAGLMTDCEIQEFSEFSRKSYFYPDLPKGYQTTQFEYPVCLNGFIDLVDTDSKPFRARIQRMHIEEDAGKNRPRCWSISFKF